MTPPAAAASSAHRGRVAAPPRPRVAPPRPRRVSGPVRRPAGRVAPAAQPLARAERGLLLGLLGAAGSLTGHGAIDRLIRGRIWIAVIAFALIGIVTLQLLVLQLNANIGHALVREAQLQRQNAALSIEGSELAGGERVEAKAAHLGMQLVPVGSLRFLTSYPPADIARAAAALSTPVHNTSTAATSAGSGEAGASGESSSTAASSSSTAEATNASGEQGASGEQSSEQSSSGEQAPATEATPPASTQSAAGTGEASSTGEASAPASAPATAAGGTEPTGVG